MVLKLKRATVTVPLIITCSLGLVLPFILESFDYSVKINGLAIIGNIAVYASLLITIFDIILILGKKDFIVLPLISLALIAASWIILDYAFIQNYTDFDYVWNYTNALDPLEYKILAIWAGQAGSILTWLLVNTIIIVAFRVKASRLVGNRVANRAKILAMFTILIFLVLLIPMTPFAINVHFLLPDGRGLSISLMSPYMLWHPVFTFISFAVFQIPFFLSLAKISVPAEVPMALQQYEEGILKIGWFVISLGIGFGSFWASQGDAWGRYWGWDPIETGMLVPWVLATAAFHTRKLRQELPHIEKINLLLIFMSIVLGAFITRGGGLNSIHSFISPLTGELLIDQILPIVITFIVGAASLGLTVYVIYHELEILLNPPWNKVRFFDNFSYICLMVLAFICILGLTFPTLSLIIAMFDVNRIIYIAPEFFIIGGLYVSIFLAIALTFCALIRFVPLRKICWGITMSFGGSIALISIFDRGILEWNFIAIAFYGSALFGAIFNLIKSSRGKDIADFFRSNGKTIIHMGLTEILIGTILGNAPALQTFFYLTGFFTMIISIIPAILISFLRRN